MTLESTFCRLCDSRCGLKAEVVNDRIVGLHPDSDDPVGAGFICDVAQASTPSRTPLGHRADEAGGRPPDTGRMGSGHR